MTENNSQDAHGEAVLEGDLIIPNPEVSSEFDQDIEVSEYEPRGLALFMQTMSPAKAGDTYWYIHNESTSRGYGKGKLSAVLESPSRDLKEILARQAVLTEFSNNPEATERHQEDLANAFELMNQFERLFGLEKHRRERTTLQAVAREYQNPEDFIADVAAGKVNQPFRKLLKRAQYLPQYIAKLSKLATNLQDSKNPDIRCLGTQIEDWIKVLPNFEFSDLFYLLRPRPDSAKLGHQNTLPVHQDDLPPQFGHEAVSNCHKTLKRFIELMEWVKMIFDFSERIQSEGFTPVTFDQRRAETFTDSWHMGHDKYGKKSEWDLDEDDFDDEDDEDWGADYYDDDATEDQVLNSAPKDSPVTLLAGANMSGKSHYLQNRYLMQLCAQSFGYAPAKDVNLNLYDTVVFLDRANTDSEDGLSAFGKEIENVKGMLECLERGETALILADESFSTTSPLEQNALMQATIGYILGRGGRLYLANHNEALIEFLGNHSETNTYHLATAIDEKTGDLVFLHELTPGHENSKSLEVAVNFGVDPSMLQVAESYLRDDVAPIELNKITRPNVRAYSPEEREALKKMAKGIMGFFAKDRENKIVIHRESGDDYTDLYWYYDPDRNGHYSGEEGIYRLDNEMNIEKGAFLKAYTDESDLEDAYLFGRDTDLSILLKYCGISDATELQERPYLFRGLANIDLDLAVEARKPRNFADLTQALFSDRSERYEQIPKLRMSNFFASCLENTGKRFMEEPDLEFVIPFIGHLEELFDVDEILEWNTLKSVLNACKDFHPIYKNIRGNQFYPERITPAMEQEFEAGFRKLKTMVSPYCEMNSEFSLGHLIEVICKKLAALVPEHHLCDFDWRKIEKHLTPFANTLSDHDDEIPRVLWALSHNQPLGQNILTELRGQDSVHLHQWANHLEPIFDFAFEGLPTGLEMFKKLTELPTDSGRKTHVSEVANILRRYGNPISFELGKIGNLQEIARYIKEYNFCDVEFTNDGTLEIINAVNMLENPVGQVANSTVMSDKNPIKAVTGSNMSGKTFSLRKDAVALLCAHTLGMAPAESMSIPSLDGIVYLDRVHNEEYEDDSETKGLSAFGSEITRWKEIFNRVKNGEKLFIAVDEAFSTTSSSLQSALSYAACDYIARHGSLLAISSHNHTFLETLLAKNPAVAQAFHLAANQTDGEVNFTYQQQPGHMPSLAIEVAEHLGLPVEVTGVANVIRNKER